MVHVVEALRTQYFLGWGLDCSGGKYLEPSENPKP